MKLTTTIMILLFLAQTDFAQQNTKDSTGLVMDSIDLATDSTIAVDSVNIREMVQQQITAVKKKMQEKKESATQISINNEKKVLKETNRGGFLGIIDKISEFISKSNEDVARVVLLGGSTFLVFGTLLIRRIRIKKKNLRHKKLVKNINSIRKEKVIANDDPKLKNVRIKLKSNPEQFSEENSLGQTAKELNISKGELLLAAKIKSYELSKISS